MDARARRGHADPAWPQTYAQKGRAMTFRLVDCVDIADGSTIRRIALYEGELTDIPRHHRADILVVSAFPQ